MLTPKKKMLLRMPGKNTRTLGPVTTDSGMGDTFCSQLGTRGKGALGMDVSVSVLD